MYIRLQFDCHSYILSLPDDLKIDVRLLQHGFLGWIQDNPECFVELKSGEREYRFNEQHFKEYVDTVVLKGRNTKVEFVNPAGCKEKDIPVLMF